MRRSLSVQAREDGVPNESMILLVYQKNARLGKLTQTRENHIPFSR